MKPYLFTLVDKHLVKLAVESYSHCNLRDGNVEAWVVKDEHTQTCDIGFRGTAKNESNWSLLRDLITDIRFLPTRHPNIGVVPRGFLIAAERIADDIGRTVNKRYKINLCGHSLGGVLAEVVGAMLVSRGFYVVHIRTFGSPGGGKLILLNSVDVVGFKFGRDAVTLGPPFIARHRKPIQIGPKGNLFTDHSSENYLEFITNGK